MTATFDWDALAAAGMRLLGDYCDGPHGGRANDGVYRVPGRAGWYCRPCYPAEWVAAGRPELPAATSQRKERP